MYIMGTITVNVSDDVEHDFREKVIQLYGKKKGTLGNALEEAMKEWSKKNKYFETCMELLDKGIDMGKLKYSKREELYDRH